MFFFCGTHTFRDIPPEAVQHRGRKTIVLSPRPCSKCMAKANPVGAPNIKVMVWPEPGDSALNKRRNRVLVVFI